MTPEQVKELREIAEYQKNWYSTANDGEYIFKKHLKLLDYVLATIHTDDHLPITADWLREEYGDNLLEPTEDYNVECYCYQFGDNDSCLNVEAESRRVYMYDAGSDRVISELEHITTRHQFRQLATALGMNYKEPNQ